MINPRKFPFSFLTNTTFQYDCFRDATENCRARPAGGYHRALSKEPADVTPSNPINSTHIRLRFRCTFSTNMHNTTYVNQHWRPENYSKIYGTFTFNPSVHCVLNVFRPLQLSSLWFKYDSQNDRDLRTSLSSCYSRRVTDQTPINSNELKNHRPSLENDSHSNGQQLIGFNVGI
jgi:hypothetical protein